MNFLEHLRQLDLKDGLALWGALLSSVLGIVKLGEWWRDRHRIDISYSFTTSEDIGNLIKIRNLSNRQIIITHWELFVAHGRSGKQERHEIQSAEFDDGDRIVAANSSYEMLFSEQYHFSTSHKFLRGRSIFLTLWVAGRRPMTCTVYRDAGQAGRFRHLLN